MQPREGALRCTACVKVEGQATPAVMPLTPERLWQVLQHHAEKDNAWSQVQQRLFWYHTAVALDGDVVRVAPTYPYITGADRRWGECHDMLQQTLTRLMGRPMTVVVEAAVGGDA